MVTIVLFAVCQQHLTIIIKLAGRMRHKSEKDPLHSHTFIHYYILPGCLAAGPRQAGGVSPQICSSPCPFHLVSWQIANHRYSIQECENVKPAETICLYLVLSLLPDKL